MRIFGYQPISSWDVAETLFNTVMRENKISSQAPAYNYSIPKQTIPKFGTQKSFIQKYIPKSIIKIMKKFN